MGDSKAKIGKGTRRTTRSRHKERKGIWTRIFAKEYQLVVLNTTQEEYTHGNYLQTTQKI